MPELISVGYASMRIEEGAVVRVRRYGASTTAVTADYSWEAKPLFPNVITLAGGSLELDKEAGNALIEIPSTSISAAIALVRGQGEAFGKKLFTVSTKSTTVPEACFSVAEGETLPEAERTPDENGRLLIDAAKSPKLVYASSVSASDQEAVTLFGLIPRETENGYVVDKRFGISDFTLAKVNAETALSPILKVSVDLPTETASTRALLLCVLQTAPDGTVSTVYPTTGAPAALTTFTRDAADSPRFSATITCPALPQTLGTTLFSIRAYSALPTN
ncbi:MAG: hypothetical protein ACI4RT_03480 [Candidatus Spyradenecus sp.]